ncbi:MAG: hypothetical protein V4616_14870 [Bacteroidota bacterium]
MNPGSIRIIEQLISFFTIAVIIYSAWNSGKNHQLQEKPGQQLYKMHPAYRIWGVMLMAVSILLLTGPFVFEGVFYSTFPVAASLGFIGTLLYLIGRNHLMTFDDTTIEAYNYLGKGRFIIWSDVRKVRYSKGMLTIEDLNHRKLKIHRHTGGIPNLLEAITTRTDLSGPALNTSKWTS